VNSFNFYANPSTCLNGFVDLKSNIDSPGPLAGKEAKASEISLSKSTFSIAGAKYDFKG